MLRCILTLCTLLLFLPLFSQPQKKVQSLPVKTMGANPLFNVKDDPSPVKYLQFKKDTPVYKPQHFYIAAVVDTTGRADSIGFTLQPKSGKQQKVMFVNGTLNAFKEYVDFKIAKDSLLYPVTMVIKEAALSEEKEKDYRNGIFKYNYSFEYRGKEKPFTISAFEGRFSYSHHFSQPKMALDSMLSLTIMNGIDNTDKNMEDAIANYPAFCKAVDVNISYQAGNTAGSDTIFYNGTQELNWDDFASASSGGDSYFMSHMGILFSPDVDYSNGKMHVTIKTGAYFVRSLSWAGKRVRVSAMRYHLQYKFYLVWLEAVRLKKKIEAAVLTCSNYESEIRTLLLNSNRQLQYVLDEYTKQTVTGSNQKEQYRWQQFIDKQLEEYEKPF